MRNYQKKIPYKDFLTQQGLQFGFNNIQPQLRSYSKIRVVQPKVLYVIGIPSSIFDEEILSSFDFFGKYGKILKLLLIKNPNLNQKNQRWLSHSAYVTYEDQISCSLALISVFQFKYDDMIMRSCFGYCKYCQAFFYKKQCTKTNCVYLHQIQRNRQILAGKDFGKEGDMDRARFQKQLLIALKVVYKHRKSIMEKYKTEEQSQQGFVTVFQSMRILVKHNLISDIQYNQQWSQYQQCHNKSITQLTTISPREQSRSDVTSQNLFQQQLWSQKSTIKTQQIQNSNISQIESIKTPTNENMQTDEIEANMNLKIERKILRVLRTRPINNKARSLFYFVKRVNKQQLSSMQSVMRKQFYRTISI